MGPKTWFLPSTAAQRELKLEKKLQVLEEWWSLGQMDQGEVRSSGVSMGRGRGGSGQPTAGLQRTDCSSSTVRTGFEYHRLHQSVTSEHRQPRCNCKSPGTLTSVIHCTPAFYRGRRPRAAEVSLMQEGRAEEQQGTWQQSFLKPGVTK